MTELSPEFTTDAHRIARGEVPFQTEELFISRTDERGVIQAGNTVFQRVAGYEWSELIGAPHKIVRHPDTPKGLFYLLWSRLKEGKQTSFYVKNADKEGRYYWVYAVVAPIDGGYVSTRLKPTSPLLKKVQAIYDGLLTAEKAGELTPETSAERLVDEVCALGFADYEIYQSVSLATEMKARATELNRELDPILKRFLALADAIGKIEAETTEMTEAFKAIRTVPLNMRIVASRLESAGGPISAISVNYSQMLEEMSSWTRNFVDGKESVFAAIRNAILRGQFLGFATGLLREMRKTLAKEGANDQSDFDLDQEMERSLTIVNGFKQETRDALVAVETETMRLGRSVLDMKRYVTGLSSTRMMCKIENASLANSGTALSGIVDQLDACQDEIEARLARIVEQNALIQSNTSMLRTML